MTAVRNTVTRTIDPTSPVWAPFVINIGLLAIIGAVRLYNYIETPMNLPKIE